MFPYSYIKSEECLEEGLPSIESFYNDLNDKPCSQEDYRHVTNVWEKCNIHNLGELMEIYCMTDVILLAEVFQKHREITLEEFGIDPVHYFSAPGTFF